MNKTTLCLLLGTLGVTSANAAEITVDPSGNTGLIVIEGRLNQGDDDTFRARIAGLRTPSTVVALNSPGGDLRAGIEIGTIVRMRGFATAIPAGFECASACGLIWLAGTPRTILYDDQGSYGRVGFHAAVNPTTGQQSVGNAIAGAYFGKLGLGDDAIAYMTDAAPESIQWLTSADAQRLGIKVNYVKQPTQEAALPAAPQVPVPQNPTPTTRVLPGSAASPSRVTTPDVTQEAVEDWLRSFFARGNAPNTSQTRESILGWYYGPQHGGGQTWSYGKYMMPDELLADKRKFMARWPDRLYTLREGSVTFNWTAGDWFDVSGIVDWTCSAPERQQTSVGSEQFTFGMHREQAGGFTIIKENGQIITRTVSKAPEAVYQPK
jgi:hypothetical protein